MDFLLLLEAIIKLGIPMVILSWIIFTWLYGGGDLDRNAGRKSIEAQVKKIKKHGGNSNYMMEKWMWFGSGFYGLAGLWTFAVIEIGDLLRVIFNPSSIPESFDHGFVTAAVELVLNQLGNLITAFLWFSYWADNGIITWLLVAYVGCWIGVELARRGEDMPLQVMLRKFRSMLP